MKEYIRQGSGLVEKPVRFDGLECIAEEGVKGGHVNR